MGLGDAGWNDRVENYADGWTKRVTASTAENLVTTGNIKQPVVVYSITVTVSQGATVSGDVSLVDTSATADAGTARWRGVISSASPNAGMLHADFPRGMRFDDGVVVSATAVTGAISITYKPRYS